MLSIHRKFILLFLIWAALFYTAGCGSAGSDTAADQTEELQAQAVSQPPPTFTPAPTPQQPATELKTEIVEPVSPVSPVSPAPTEMESGMSTTDTVKVIPGSEDALAAAIKDLSEQTGIPAGEITLVSIEAVEWGDTSLGCPQEGYMYAQVITPGYKLILAAQGQQYQYHTDQKANVVLCQQ